jgi:hypothetical protein
VSDVTTGQGPRAAAGGVSPVTARPPPAGPPRAPTGSGLLSFSRSFFLTPPEPVGRRPDADRAPGQAVPHAADTALHCVRIRSTGIDVGSLGTVGLLMCLRWNGERRGDGERGGSAAAPARRTGRRGVARGETVAVKTLN